MANVKTGVAIPQKNNVIEQAKKKSVAMAMNELLDREGMKNRINELLGKRAPQFTGSLVSLVNADTNMQKVFADAPMTIIQSALKAATYDLPIDPGLGYAYIVPFKNKQKDGSSRMEASFIMGYKGMYQLAMRTGAYKKLNVTDVRESELIHYDRLTEDIELQFIEDEEKREKLPVIGYCGFFRLVNGMEKYIYMSIKQIKAHEAKNRKGQYMSKGWRDDFDAMASKTVLRKLIGKWGIMSIDYQNASPAMIQAAEAIAKGDDEDVMTIEASASVEQLDDGRMVDTSTGELFGKDAEFTAEEIEEAMK